MKPSLVPPGSHSRASEDLLAEHILNCADFCGYQEDGKGGSIQLWNLRKTISPQLVAKSIVSRETLRQHFKFFL